MISFDSWLECEHQNAERQISERAQLEEEARAVGADEAAAFLARETSAAREVMKQFPAAVQKYEAAYRWRDAKAAELKSAEDSQNPVMRSAAEHEFSGAHRAMLGARAACTKVLFDAVEARKAEFEPVRYAERNIEAITNSCLSAFKQHWIAANARIDKTPIDRAAGIFEPIFARRAIQAYPKLAHGKANAQPLEVLKECFALRTEQRPKTVPRIAPKRTAKAAAP
jgi:hypothetical protein